MHIYNSIAIAIKSLYHPHHITTAFLQLQWLLKYCQRYQLALCLHEDIEKMR